MQIQGVCVTVLCLVALATSGCASPPDGAVVVDGAASIPTIQQRYADRLEKAVPGLSIQEFKTLFPEATIVAQQRQMTAYELATVDVYVTKADMTRQNLIWGVGSPSRRTNKQTIWFYFANDKLVQWGKPQEWPSQE